jgi:superfamily II DNA or RNA helicase
LQVVKIDGLSLAPLRTSGGDWTAEQIDAAFAEDGPLHAVARPCAELIPHGQQALLFCAGVNSAEGLAAVLNNYRPGSARWVCGDKRRCPPEERARTVAEFKAGRLTYLVNVGCFTEGFNHPPTAFIVLARPTTKEGLMLQMMGRGTRPLPDTVDGLSGPAARIDAIAASGKPRVTVLDFVGSSGRFDLRQVTAADVLGEECSQDVRERARAILERAKGGGDVQQALDLAAEQLDAEHELAKEIAERERLRRALRAEVSYRVEDAGTIGVGDQRLPRYDPPASQGQRGMLYRLGVPWKHTERLTKRQASGWIGKLLRQQELQREGVT